MKGVTYHYQSITNEGIRNRQTPVCAGQKAEDERERREDGNVHCVCAGRAGQKDEHEHAHPNEEERWVLLGHGYSRGRGRGGRGANRMY